jgi:hypothetical protein
MRQQLPQRAFHHSRIEPSLVGQPGDIDIPASLRQQNIQHAHLRFSRLGDPRRT